jgi:predicted NBD/HSP70 family sugar kinase
VAEFLRQYAMIVLSIITALALERGAVAYRDATAARQSRARIEAELARDMAELAQAEQVNADSAHAIGAVLKTLVAALKQGKIEQTALRAILQPAFDHFAVSMPSWQHDAWDSALADQTASHLDSADLRRYAEIYATERDLDATAQLLLSGDALMRGATARVDLALGTLDGRDMANVLARFVLAVSQIDRGERDLQTLIATGHNPEEKQARP